MITTMIVRFFIQSTCVSVVFDKFNPFRLELRYLSVEEVGDEGFELRQRFEGGFERLRSC